MEAILDFSAPVNVKAFDDIFAMFSEGGRGDIARAQEILEEFKKHPDAFFKVDKLLTTSNTLGTKFFALQVLDDTIMQRWNTLDVENQQAIRNFILNLIVQECTTFPHIRSKNTRAFLTKLNSTLVSIAKREWPIRWPTFVQDICSIADPTLPLVENNLNLLRIVGEEVFQFGEKTLTSRWIERKKQALANDFKSIVNLCVSVLTATQDFCLMNVALETLTAYAPWMSPSLICSTILLERVCDLVSVPEVRVHAVHCLAEICSVTVDSGSQGDEQTNLIVCAFRTALERVVMVLPTSHSEVMHRVVQLYDCGSSFDREYVVYLNLLITSFLRNRCKSISYDEVLLVTSHKLMVGMSYISDKELFKSCVEYWWWLGDLMLRSPASNVKKNLMTKLAPVLSDVRYVLIRRMAKPEEVVIVEDDNELRREHMQDVEELQLYQLMRESLVFLTNLDSRDTRGIMVKLMEKLLDRSEWSWHNCNTLAWAVGAISMALPVEDEEELFVTIVKGLLLLCKEMVGKENRAVVASAIIFVVGQYPRFLRSHLPFLYTVSRKIFEFMREPFPGVQDMAIDTLLKLTKQLAPCYVDRRTEPTFANVMAAQWPTIIELLNQPQVQSSFAAVGYIIEAELADSQAQLLYAFLNELNLRFKALTSTATTPGSNFCSNAMSMTELLHYMRIYSSVADSCGDAFIHQMNLIIYDLYGFYRLFSAAQKTTIAEGGVTALSRQETKYLRLLKREVLRIFERFVEHTGHLDFVATNCLPDLLGVVLEDYRDSIPEAKEAGALALVAACVRSLGDRLSCECEPILDHTFNTTVAMISDSMESYPEFRVNLFKLLDAFNKHCFTAFVMYASVHEDVLGGMLWAIKHTDYPTMSTGLELLNHFLANVQTSNFAEPFFMAYLQRILVEVLVAAMDSLHAAGFSLHCSILMKVFAVSASLPFDTPVVGAEAVLSFLRENLRAIPTLTEASIDAFVKECYQCTRDEARFRTMFADFLVEVKVWGAEQENKMQEEDERRLREETIPGFSSLFSDPPPNAFHQSHMSHNSVDFGNMSLL